MGALKTALLAVLLSLTSPAAADPVLRWNADIAEASARFDVPTEWIRQVMRAESGGRPSIEGRPIVSRAGAMGLMQLMPATWEEMRRRFGLGPDPHDPHDNILAGTAYLRLMYDRFGYPGLFAAYNAGPARYARHLAGGGLPRETLAYLAAITGAGTPARSPVRSASSGSGLFAIRYALPASSPTPGGPAAREAGASLFALRGTALAERQVPEERPAKEARAEGGS